MGINLKGKNLLIWKKIIFLVHIQYSFEALYIKVNKQKVIKPLFQPKKSRKYMEVYPIPTPGFLFLIASVMKLTFAHYETFGLTKVLQDYPFKNENPV